MSRVAILYDLKYSVFNNNKKVQGERRNKCGPYRRIKAVGIVPEKAQVSGLLDKEFKSVVLTIFNELRKIQELCCTK